MFHLQLHYFYRHPSRRNMDHKTPRSHCLIMTERNLNLEPHLRVSFLFYFILLHKLFSKIAVNIISLFGIYVSLVFFPQPYTKLWHHYWRAITRFQSHSWWTVLRSPSYKSGNMIFCKIHFYDNAMCITMVSYFPQVLFCTKRVSYCHS